VIRSCLTHPARGAPVRHAFTLVELIAVMVVGAIIAATAIPVIGRLDESRAAALTDDVARLAADARARALRTGRPTALRFDLRSSLVERLWLPAEGDAPAPFAEPLAIISRYPGVDVSAIDLTEGDADTLWFAPDGPPHLRTDSGVFERYLTESASITIEGAGQTFTIRVLPTTGAIQR
jgi:prepilin-type N-terminal cleavage/methylation domain-containing protein